jgi:hypothetical protein
MGMMAGMDFAGYWEQVVLCGPRSNRRNGKRRIDGYITSSSWTQPVMESGEVEWGFTGRHSTLIIAKSGRLTIVL